MRFMLLTPGTGHFYCGSCLRDNTLGNSLRRLGHQVETVPLYLPMVLEEPEVDRQRVQMGGINMYLQQKATVFQNLPRWLADLLDSPGLLRWASRRGNMTEAKGLGAMVLSMLRGDQGRQAAEVDKLAARVAAGEPPDVVILSNAMLVGVVRRLKSVLACPVVSTLQGEGPFLDALPEPFAQQAWQELRRRAAEVDVFVAVSHWYGTWMRSRLDLAENRVRVVHNAIDLDGFEQEPPALAERVPPTIGYMARMCRDKGLHTLVRAFALLHERGPLPGLRLRIAGVMLEEDRPFVTEQQTLLRERGCLDRVTFEPNVSREEKLTLLRSLSALSVPATYGESFGLYLLEAMAAGVPVVQPRHGAFPEVLEATGGGILCAPDDPESLADTLLSLLLEPVRAQALAAAGRRSVLENFGAERMAREVEAVCLAAAQAGG